MEENVASAVIGAEESEALGFEICHHAAGLFTCRRFPVAALTGFPRGRSRTARLIADSLFYQREIGFAPLDVGSFRGNFQVRIALPGLFKQPFLTCVQEFPLVCAALC